MNQKPKSIDLSIMLLIFQYLKYSITKQTTKEIAEKIQKDAYDFVNKIELILMKK
jgi:hypothetical protein